LPHFLPAGTPVVNNEALLERGRRLSGGGGGVREYLGHWERRKELAVHTLSGGSVRRGRDSAPRLWAPMFAREGPGVTVWMGKRLILLQRPSGAPRGPRMHVSPHLTRHRTEPGGWSRISLKAATCVVSSKRLKITNPTRLPADNISTELFASSVPTVFPR